MTVVRKRNAVVFAGLPGLVYGFRLLVLAVVAASGAFLGAGFDGAALVGGILTGAAIGAAQYRASSRGHRIRGEVFVLAHVAVWTFLVQASSGSRSPLFVGYLLEIPMSTASIGRRGCVLTAVAAAVAYLGSSAILGAGLDPAHSATAIGFLALTALVSWWLAGVLSRQQRRIDESEAALRTRAENLAEELRLLGDYLNGALVGLDDLGRVVSVNDAGLALLDQERESVVGRAWQEVLRVDAAGSARVCATLADGRSQRGVQLVISPHGSRPLAAQADLWTSPSAMGRRIYILISVDRSEGTESDPLRRLGEAVACVSHQIKNSLHALEGLASRIGEQPGAQNGGRESAQQLVRALRSLGELADDCLAMSGAPRPPIESLKLHEIVSSSVVLARHPSVPVRLSVPDRGIEVRAQRGPLVHALFNLIDNACRANPPGRPVEVRLSETCDLACVEIQDGGAGIPADFVTGNRRVASRRGSGYGLLAARRFLVDNGGRLTFTVPPGGGTLCRVTLPRVSSAPPAGTEV